MASRSQSKIIGVSIVPHTTAPEMRYAQQRGPGPAALVRLFVKGGGIPGMFNGKSPAELLKSGEWAWHDTATAIEGTAETLSVWSFNGKSAAWGPGNTFTVDGDGIEKATIRIDQPKAAITTVTYRGPDGAIHPDRIVVHVRNDNKAAL